VTPVRALVIQHEEPTPGGYVHQWLADRGAEQEVLRIDVDGRAIDLSEYDVIVPRFRRHDSVAAPRTRAPAFGSRQ
jgi:hypothetical protein